MLSQYDQSIRDAGYKYIPQSQYLLDPFKIPGDGSVENDTFRQPTGIASLGGGGGGGGFNPYNIDMSQIRQDYRPNFDFRQFQDFEGRYGDSLETMDRKQMDMYPDYYGVNTGVPKTGIGAAFSKIADFIPYVGTFKRGAEFVGGLLKDRLPINQRALLENELRGSGVFTDDIGRIVAGPGGYNTPEGIMAGYNANQMTEQTFDKRTGNISETLGKKGISQNDIQGIIDGTLTEEDIEDKYGITTNLISNLRNINIAKQNFIKTQNKAAEIARFEEQQRKEKAFQDQLNQQQRDQRQSDLNRIDRAYKEETGGQGGSYATGESGVQSDGSYNDPFDPGGGEKDGGFIDGTNRRMDFSNGGLSTYEIRQLLNLGFDTKGGTDTSRFGGLKVLRDIPSVNKYAGGGIVGLYR